MLARKLRRDATEHMGVLSAIASIMAVGVICFVTMRSSYHNLSEAKAQYYAQCRMADFWIDIKKAPLTALESVRSIRGVREIQDRLQFSVTVDLDDEPGLVNGLVISLPDMPRTTINGIIHRQGGYFSESEPNEVLVNDAFARSHAIVPGDRLYLLLNNRRESMLVVGTAVSSEFAYMIGPGSMVPDPKHFGVFYVKRTFLEEVYGFEGAFNQIVGKLTPEAMDEVELVLDSAENALDSYGVLSRVPRKDQISNRFLSDEIQQLGQFAYMIPAIFLGVAILVLGILMKRLTDQQRTTIGTLKAIGYSDTEIYVHLIGIGVLVGLAGGLVGCAAGQYLAGGLTRLYRRFFELPGLENRLFLDVHVQALLVSLATAMLGVGYGARSALKLEPAEAMRPKPPPVKGIVSFEFLGKAWMELSLAWKMTIRSLVRDWRRNVVGGIAAAMAASLLVIGFLSQDAIRFGINFQFREIQRSDVDLVFTTEHDEGALREARRLPGVDHAEPVLEVACTFRNAHRERRGVITGLSPLARLTIPRDLQGNRVPIPSTGLAIGRTLARELQVRPGEWLWVEPVRGDREPRPVLVSSIVDSFIGQSVYADIHYLSHLMNEDLALSGVQLQMTPSPDAMTAFLTEIEDLPSLQAVNQRDQIVANLQSSIVDANKASSVVLILFAGTICFGATLNASLVGLEERRRDVATMLVLGYTPRTMGGLFLRESLIVNLVGSLAGLPLGQWLFRFIVEMHQTDLFRLPQVPPGRAFGLTLLLSLGFGLISHAFVQRSINRIDIQDQMRVRE